MNTVDTHAHVFSASDQCIETARYTPKYDASVEQYIAHLDEHHFKCGVLIQPSFFGTNNQVMLEAIEKFPDRLKGIAVVDPSTPYEELFSLKQKGITGIRLNLFGLSIPALASPEWKRFLSDLEKLEWQIELHAPVNYLIEILPILNPYTLDIVIDHFGRVDSLDEVLGPNYTRFLQLVNPDKHWIKVSGFYRLGKESENIRIAKEAYQLFKDRRLLHKLVWGSDWPHTQYESSISYDKSLKIFRSILEDEKEQRLILKENPCRLFNLECC